MLCVAKNILRREEEILGKDVVNFTDIEGCVLDFEDRSSKKFTIPSVLTLKSKQAPFKKLLEVFFFTCS